MGLELITSKIQGEEFCKQIKTRQEYDDIPIVIMKALVSKIRKGHILEKNDADALIVKPIAQLGNLDQVVEYI